MVLALLLLLFKIDWAAEGPAPDSELQSTSLVTHSENEGSAAPARSARLHAQPPSDGEPSAASSRHQPSSLARRAAQSIEPGDWLHFPESMEEVDWLNRHGFPSADAIEQASFDFRSIEDFAGLRAFSAENVARAKFHALASPETAQAAIDFLERAAVDGSIFALEALAAVHEAHGGPQAQLVSAAFLRASELRGNWPRMLLRPEFAALEESWINLQAAGILAGLDEARAAQGLPALGFSPRPGLEEFLEALSRALAENPDLLAAPAGPPDDAP